MIKVKVKDLVHMKSCKYDGHPGILYYCTHRKSWFHLSNNNGKAGEVPEDWDYLQEKLGWGFSWWLANNQDEHTYEDCFDETEWPGYGTIITPEHESKFQVGKQIHFLNKSYLERLKGTTSLYGGNECQGVPLYDKACKITYSQHIGGGIYSLSVTIFNDDGSEMMSYWGTKSTEFYENYNLVPPYKPRVVIDPVPAKPKVDLKTGHIDMKYYGGIDPANMLGEFLRNMDGTVTVLKSDISNSCNEITLPSSNHSTIKIPNPTLDTYKPSKVTTDYDVRGNPVVNKKSTDEMLIFGLI